MTTKEVILLIEGSYHVNPLQQLSQRRLKSERPLSLFLYSLLTPISTARTKRKSIHGLPANRKDKATRNRYRAEGEGGGGGSARFLLSPSLMSNLPPKERQNHLTRTLIDALPLANTRRKRLQQTARCRRPTQIYGN